MTTIFLLCDRLVYADDTQEVKNDAGALCHKIMMEDQSLEYKLEMLNKFAGGFYLRDTWPRAVFLPMLTFGWC
jgi:hypothetical protein